MALVEAFQRARGLPLTGEVDETTWTRLCEAHWHLGERLLFETNPYLRGDDVAALQVALAQLGFNPGRIDGIFGPLLDEALREFQQNRDLEASGTLTRATLAELERMRATDTGRHLVNDAARPRGLRRVDSDVVLLCGEGPLLARLADALDDCVARVMPGVAPEAVARYANEHEVALVMSFQSLAQVDGVHLHYWASYRSHSRRGEQLASALAATLSHLEHAPRVEVTGMALPILRETRMTTVHVEHGPLSEQVLHRIITALEGLVDQVIHSS